MGISIDIDEYIEVFEELLLEKPEILDSLWNKFKLLLDIDVASSILILPSKTDTVH